MNAERSMNPFSPSEPDSVFDVPDFEPTETPEQREARETYELQRRAYAADRLKSVGNRMSGLLLRVMGGEVLTESELVAVNVEWLDVAGAV